MIKTLIAGAIGSRYGTGSRTRNGVAGGVVRAAIPFVASRVSLPLLIAVGAGGYLVKRIRNRRPAR
jgi:hypothetical protein